MNKFSIGERFGRLLVLKYIGKTYNHKTIVSCKCDCGVKIEKRLNDLRSGHTKSCGCLHSESVKRKRTNHEIRHLFGNKFRLAHGKTMSPEYYIWRSMKARCNNPKTKSYSRYGGRGIKVCDRWINSFENFFLDMGKRPTKKHQLDRIDNEGHYEPKNCRWTTIEVNSSNKSNNKFITFKNQTLTISQWCDKIGINRGGIKKRLDNGWSIKDALTVKPLPKGKERVKCKYSKVRGTALHDTRLSVSKRLSTVRTGIPRKAY